MSSKGNDDQTATKRRSTRVRLDAASNRFSCTTRRARTPSCRPGRQSKRIGPDSADSAPAFQRCQTSRRIRLGCNANSSLSPGRSHTGDKKCWGEVPHGRAQKSHDVMLIRMRASSKRQRLRIGPSANRHFRPCSTCDDHAARQSRRRGAGEAWLRSLARPDGAILSHCQPTVSWTGAATEAVTQESTTSRPCADSLRSVAGSSVTHVQLRPTESVTVRLVMARASGPADACMLRENAS